MGTQLAPAERPRNVQQNGARISVVRSGRSKLRGQTLAIRRVCVKSTARSGQNYTFLYSRKYWRGIYIFGRLADFMSHRQ